MDVDLLDRVRQEARLADREAAREAVRAVVCGLRERLDGEELEHLRASLGAEATAAFTCNREEHPHRPAEKRRDRLTEPEMVARLQQELALGSEAEARAVLRAVLAAIVARVGETPEELENEAVSVGSLGRPRGGEEGGDE